MKILANFRYCKTDIRHDNLVSNIVGHQCCALQQEDGAIDPPKSVQDVRPEPYPLPDRSALLAEHTAQCFATPVLLARQAFDSLLLLCSFLWCECDINNNEVVKEVTILAVRISGVPDSHLDVHSLA